MGHSPGGTGNAVRVVGFEEWTIDDGGLIAASWVDPGSEDPPGRPSRPVGRPDGRRLARPSVPDGRRLGDLRPGDPVDGATVVSVALEAYDGGATFDLLPSGPTGTYWANDILLASTLAGRAWPDQADASSGGTTTAIRKPGSS